MKIVYTRIALEDLQRIPKRFAAQIVTKILRLENGLHGNIKRLTNFDCDYRLRCGDYRVLLTLKVKRSSCIVFCTARKRMTKAVLKHFTAELTRKRREVCRLQEDLAT